MAIPMEILLTIIIGTPLILRLILKNNAQKVFNTMIEEKMDKIDDMSRSIDRIVHVVKNHKSKILPPKLDINESIKSLYVSMDQSKKVTASNSSRFLS